MTYFLFDNKINNDMQSILTSPSSIKKSLDKPNKLFDKIKYNFYFDSWIKLKFYPLIDKLIQLIFYFDNNYWTSFFNNEDY